ncbi:MAG: UDP-N-acetylglucosamine 1-carboxyvinyltransferase [Erysipelotrichaceae bacterium]|nr:UDP-N-acetylglucosamine 1-carboxyvinyltransferase [Erysipelotrichaceae bacterium]
MSIFIHILMMGENMKKIIIKKANDIKGTVKINGSKNAAIPILCTSILTKGRIIFSNIPKITDIKIIIKILRYLNCKVRWRFNKLIVDSSKIEYKSLVIEECEKLRGSYYFIPVFLYLFDKCDILLPGGCSIGSRPIDAHIEAFEALGFKCMLKDNHLWIRREKAINEASITMSKKSVGASINAILASLKCRYVILDELVLEPEALDVIAFLKEIGFDLDALSHKVVFRGFKGRVDEVVKYKIIPDRIEAMTYIVMGLLCGDVKIKGANADHFKYPLELLLKAKYNIRFKRNYIRAIKSRGNCFDIKTETYPLFPTDMQPLFGVLMAYGKGSSVIEEDIFENRMQIYKDLNSLGFNVNLIGNKAYIIGSLINEPINHEAKDLRHCAALLILLIKNGGLLSNIDLIKRGYNSIFYNIRNLGAKFKIK